MSVRTIPVLLVAALAASTGATLADDPPRGFVSAAPFERFITDDDEVVEVNVSGSLLKALARSVGSDDADAGKILGGLHSIRAIVVTIDAARYERAMQTIEGTARELLGKGWEEIAKVRSKGERIRVLALDDKDKIGGLAVMLVTNDEESGKPQLIFANVAGPLDLSDIDMLADTVKIPGLEEAGAARRGERVTK